jgi:hypothetical protein
VERRRRFAEEGEQVGGDGIDHEIYICAKRKPCAEITLTERVAAGR